VLVGYAKELVQVVEYALELPHQLVGTLFRPRARTDSRRKLRRERGLAHVAGGRHAVLTRGSLDLEPLFRRPAGGDSNGAAVRHPGLAGGGSFERSEKASNRRRGERSERISGSCLARS